MCMHEACLYMYMHVARCGIYIVCVGERDVCVHACLYYDEATLQRK